MPVFDSVLDLSQI